MTDTKSPLFNDKAYNILKWVALIALPALAVAVGAFGELWHWAANVQVAGTIVIADTLLGALLQISSSRYNPPETEVDGVMTVHHDEGRDVQNFSLELNGSPEDLVNKDRIIFKVDPQQVSSMPGDVPATGYVPPAG